MQTRITYLVGEQEALHERLADAAVGEGQLTHHHDHHAVVGGLLGVNVAVGKVHLGVLQVQGADRGTNRLGTAAADTTGL